MDPFQKLISNNDAFKETNELFLQKSAISVKNFLAALFVVVMYMDVDLGLLMAT